MSVKFVMRELTLAAGQRKRVDEVASFFMLVSNTGDKKIKISIDDDPLSECPVGYEYQEKEKDSFYAHIDFMNSSASPATIEYIMSTGLVRSSPAGQITIRDIANSIETPVALLLNVGNSYTQTISADADQKGLEIQNTGANDCWYGDTNVDPATKRGIKLDVGADKILPITCSLVLKSADVDCTISYMRLKEV